MADSDITFTINAKVYKRTWNHRNCPKKGNSGAAGGRMRYEFIPTGLGTIVTAKCTCGWSKDITDPKEFG
jgi:hypothetical protein